MDFHIGLKKTADWIIENAHSFSASMVLLESQKYSGFPGNGCKQRSAQLINDTLSGKMKMP